MLNNYRKSNNLETFIVYDFTSGKRNTVFKSNIIQIINDENIFRFNEFETIEVQYLGTDYEVSIEALGYKRDDSKDVVNPKDMRVILEPNKKYCISDINDYDLGYNPGTYSITFKHKQGNTINASFDVYTNQDVSEDSIIDMAREIENFLQGLSFDFSKKVINNTEVTLSNKEQQFLLKSLVEHNKEFERVCNNISKGLNTSLSNTILKDSRGIKQNLNSIKKSIIKGQTYGVKKIEDISKSCGKLKEYLTRINNKVHDINIPFDLKIATFKKDISSLLEEIKGLEEYLESDKVTKRKRIENNIKQKKQELNTKRTRLSEYETWYLAYKGVSNSCKRLLNIKELREFDTRITIDTPIFSTDHNFAFVKEFTNLLEGKENKLEEVTNNSYALKKTSELFEIYGLVLITKALKEAGYETSINLDDTLDLESKDVFEFRRANSVIKVLYDYPCRYYKDAQEDEVVHINSRHNKPDYILVYYEDEEFKDIKIVEMKYRNLNKIFNKYPKTDISLDDTINDYYQLAYIEDLDSYPLRAVSKVVMLYPSKTETSFKRSFADVIAFNPSLSEESSESFKLLCDILKW